MRYAKRGRMRFASHRDIARALERALRRAGIPVAFSAGFTPHPKISYTGAAPTGVASEAEYFELVLTETADPEQVRVRLDAAMPEGIDVVAVVAAAAGGLVDRLEASEWRVDMPGVAPDDAAAAAAAFLAADTIEVERLTKKGRRRFDVRSAVLKLEVDGRAAKEQDETYAILRMVVRHTTPAVRPDDVVSGLRQVAGLAPPSSPLMTRLAQGPLDGASGEIADPFAADDAAALDAGRKRAESGEVTDHPVSAGPEERTSRPSAPTRSTSHE
ncbi:TIGR03936 family radical SAM-associated protein [Marinactinospora thermotolerans]|uniref:Radical SAM-linked protein n=1 Tax=Marinactinospora thermotolerans DSM 45154 TaxID=1122192 RepID=A0A1T4SPZ4_9ACTN|nr:TIGR03936 family radical SAM-associated protein [Marinactinospora thermotolerans]SKA29941.1 radical SAM-linked protein [Marinactinospora thermotolerans DSM 45154]